MEDNLKISRVPYILYTLLLKECVKEVSCFGWLDIAAQVSNTVHKILVLSINEMAMGQAKAKAESTSELDRGRVFRWSWLNGSKVGNVEFTVV